MKLLKTKLKIWNLERFRNLQQQCKEVVAKLFFFLDLKDEMKGLREEELKRRRVCLGDFWKLSRCHESFLHKKSRVRWIRVHCSGFSVTVVPFGFSFK